MKISFLIKYPTYVLINRYACKVNFSVHGVESKFLIHLYIKIICLKNSQKRFVNNNKIIRIIQCFSESAARWCGTTVWISRALDQVWSWSKVVSVAWSKPLCPPESWLTHLQMIHLCRCFAHFRTISRASTKLVDLH